MTESPDWRRSRAKRVQAAAIAALGYPLIALLGRTLRWQVEGFAHLTRLEAEGRPPVLAFWHGRILPATYYFRRRGIVVITSRNFDGEWIARIIERFGYGTARGSTSRGASRALLQLKRAMDRGAPGGVTLDGPRGPAYKAQPGAIWLAKATGSPVVPFHIEAARHWTMRSWDQAQIPKPFSRVALVVGAPISVPADADAVAMESARQALERSLQGLRDRGRAMVGGPAAATLP